MGVGQAFGDALAASLSYLKTRLPSKNYASKSLGLERSRGFVDILKLHENEDGLFLGVVTRKSIICLGCSCQNPPFRLSYW